MRRLHKSWSDKKPFTRRVKWLADVEDVHTSIVLVFDDSLGAARVRYGGKEAAEFDWDQFKLGKLNTVDLRAGR